MMKASPSQACNTICDAQECSFFISLYMKFLTGYDTIFYTSSTFQYVIKLFIYKDICTAINDPTFFLNTVYLWIFFKKGILFLFFGILVMEFGAVGLRDDFVAILLHMNN